MNYTGRYKSFMANVNWNELNNVEKQYFFEELDHVPNEDGIILRILPDKKKENYVVIIHIVTGAKLEIPKSEIKNFKKW